MNSNKITIPVRGMHCRSCELLVEDSLKELNSIDKVEVNYSTGEAIAYYHGERPSEEKINSAIKSAGYEVGKNDIKPFINLNTDNILELMVGAGILFIGYLILKSFGLTDINLNPEVSEASFVLPLLVGLVAGVSTCMALVGGLVLGLSGKFSEAHPTATRAEGFRPHLFFVGGRILGYALFGGILGMLGSVFQLSSAMNATITMLVGALMLFMGLQLTNLFPRLNDISISLPASISKLFGINKKQKEYSHKHAAVLGGLTFFLPCGFTQAMQVFAVSRGNFIDGALIMGLFALGTAPGLLSIGGLTATAKGSFKKLFFKTAGVAIIGLSLFNLNNGYSLLAAGQDWNVKSENNTTASNDPNVTMENGVQVVRMSEENSGYTPNSFTIKKGVPVKWIITANAPYSCASVIGIPKLRIQKFLKAGENIVEFTPTEVGPLKFSCSMGMYTGVFNVIDDEVSATTNSNSQVASDNEVASADPVPTAKAATCGGPSAGGCGCGGSAKKIPTNTAPKNAEATTDANTNETIQTIKATYTDAKYLEPATFNVKAGSKVRFEINVKDDGVGCGRQIAIPQLSNEVQNLEADKTLVFEFTPTETGAFDITCGMQMIQFGTINVQ